MAEHKLTLRLYINHCTTVALKCVFFTQSKRGGYCCRSQEFALLLFFLFVLIVFHKAAQVPMQIRLADKSVCLLRQMGNLINIK